MQALEKYFAILAGSAEPRYLQAKRSGALKEKIKAAYKTLSACELCERKCRANRTVGAFGACGVSKLRINSAFTHFGEEPFFVPSYTIFFSGCNLKCAFCQNYTISQLRQGNDATVEELAKIIGSAHGCKNINLVGGEPTPHLPFILDALQLCSVKLPIVWNSNFFMSLAAMELLEGVVDVYLSDWKYGNSDCAERLSGVQNYFEIVKRNHLLAFKDAELVIRHLVLPNHFSCCTKPVLEEIAKKFQDKAIVNIMDQYRPEFRASEFSEISRGLSREEFEQAIELAQALGLNFKK